MKRYQIKMRFFAFSDRCEVMMICHSKKDANEWLKLYKGCPKYKDCDIWIEEL